MLTGQGQLQVRPRQQAHAVYCLAGAVLHAQASSFCGDQMDLEGRLASQELLSEQYEWAEVLEHLASSPGELAGTLAASLAWDLKARCQPACMAAAQHA